MYIKFAEYYWNIVYVGTWRGRAVVPRDLRIGGLIVLCAAPGMALLGWFISRIAEPALMPLLGVAALMVFVGIGLLAASRAAEKASRDGTHSPHG